MGGGKDEGKIKVALYNMSIHMGLCMAGEGLKLLAIKIGEKVAWRGSRDVEGAIQIDRENLFGGLKKEGGVSGVAYFLPGGEDQILPPALSERYGKVPTNCPGFRGIASIFFVGRRSVGTNPAPGGGWNPTATTGSKGFWWGANNPYMKPVAFLVERIPRDLNPITAAIPIDPSDAGSALAANGAHMMYEAITNYDWGADVPYGAFDRASFEAAAQVLYDEKFGLCALWERQSPVEDFVNEVQDHIHSTIFLHPRTGRLTMKLLRADYDIAQLRRITPAEAKLMSCKRKVWGETANEITVTYTDPDSEEDATVTAHDLAAIAAQGRISATRDYHMIRWRKLAAAIANRDLAQTVRPMATIELEMPRAAWDLIPGEVVVMQNWVEQLHVEQMVCRVAKIVRDGPNSNTITVSLYEDIFGEHLNNYLEPEPTAWQPNSAEPAPLTSVAVMTAPAALMAMTLGVDDPADLDPPDAMVLMLAKRNSPDDAYYDLRGPVPLPNGQVQTQSLGLRDFFGTGELAAELPAAVTSTVGLDNYDGEAPRLGQFLLIGEPGSSYEIVNVSGIGDGEWTIMRGVLDTVPRSWAAGTTVWCIPDGSAIPDQTIRIAGETVSYTLLPTTSLDTLAPEHAYPVEITVSRRPHLPLRPANVKIDGVLAFGSVNAAGKSSLLLSWATRNRSYEVPAVLQWDEPSMPPEAGQTTYIRCMAADGTTVHEYDAGLATTYTLDLNVFPGDTGFIVFSAKRGEDFSQQSLIVRIDNLGP